MSDEMTADDYRALMAKRRQPKYHNQRVTVGDERYDSKAERRRHEELLLQEQNGVIENLRRQVRFPITVNGVLVTSYFADFVYFDREHNVQVIEDVKSRPTMTPIYRLKKKLLHATQGLDITDVEA